MIDALYRSGVIAAVTLALGSGQAWVPGGAAGAGQPRYRARSGQSRQAAPKAALRLRVIGRVTPVGQVTDIGWSAVGAMIVNSSIVNPPSTAGRSGRA